MNGFHSNVRKAVAGVLCCAVMLLGAGCGSNPAEPENLDANNTGQTNTEQTAKTLQKITVGEVAHSIFYAPSYAAMSLGYFEEEGLDVDLINLQGADKVMTALISDEIQIGLAGPEEPYQLRKQ